MFRRYFILAIVIFTFSYRVTADDAYVILDTNTVKEGGVIKVKLGVKEPVSAASVRFLGNKYPVFFKSYDKMEHEFVYHSIVPVPLGTTGSKDLVVAYTKKGTTNTKKEMISIRTMKSKETTVDTGGQVNKLSKYFPRENKIIKKAQEKVTAAKYEFPFIKPLENRLTGGFGDKRLYDDGTLGWRHKGFDISGRPEKNIKATNHGVAVLANATKAHGNMIVIDHGGGIYSLYFHMDKVFIRKGAKVKKGDIIGTVGSTGIATGPHLHWQMNVFGVSVNPFSFLVEFK